MQTLSVQPGILHVGLVQCKDALKDKEREEEGPGR